ncbi:hypothetical protein AGMMS50212_15450 [Spirochaetia bacterium]|nr:hypothetical protein AGMMS50212_15450 [Spirochaetia bacterium]
MGFAFRLFPQTHVAVPLEDNIYKIIDLAVQRGLCLPLVNSKPWTRAQILIAINEILSNESSGRGKLSADERQILEAEKEKYGEYKKGFDKKRGAFFLGTNILNTAVKFTVNIGLNVEGVFSQSAFTSEHGYNWGGDFWINAYLNGDVGDHLSYNALASGGVLRAARAILGSYDTYYPGFVKDEESKNRVLPTYSEPLAYFPFTYRKKWDSSVFFFDELDASGFQSWPERFAGAYALGSEMTASFLESKLLFRVGRLAREWGAMTQGGSLVLNSNARPFLGFEAQFQPVKWFSFSTMVGELEYFNQFGIKNSAWTSQNAYSITMFELNYKNYLHVDFGDAVVFLKRFEMGYLSLLTNNFFYQNNIGDFDNLMIFFNIKGQIPGIANFWFSFYDDEAQLQGGMHLLDRSMIAIQGGASINIPALPFASIKLTYTKIEPYNYTHNRIFVPWYNGPPMELAYLNNGVGIGYYLPPNSDELLFRFETMASRSSRVHFQYQMIRHGADYGNSAVDGGSYLSELDPDERNDRPVLKKFFLQDGAYQWFHILKTGGEYTFNKMPVKVYGEAGIVFSYFTNISGLPNQGYASSYSIIDTVEYPQTTSFVVTLGVKIFP